MARFTPTNPNRDDLGGAMEQVGSRGTLILEVAPRTRVVDVLVVAAGAGLIGLAAQVSIRLPWTPVPITGQTFAVLLVAAGVGLWRGLAATSVYAVAGLVGLPWFAGGAAGFVGATFGYILGFALAAAVVGWLAEHGWTRSGRRTFAAMIAGDAAIYLTGVPWLKASLHLSWATALSLGLTPFLIGDLLKAVLASGIFWVAWRRADS